jgi:polyprenyl-phospho-N-acetylgalactosaminyl synthase
MSDFRVCAIVPTYDNPQTVERVVKEVRGHLAVVIVVDDGSHAPAKAVLDRLADEPGVVLVRHAHNRGKGAAMKSGLREAAAQGFTHALQVDADGQHALDDIPRFLARAEAQPAALVLGAPQFDHTRPRIRGFGHWLTSFWTRIEVASSAIEDPQCGFRVYPVAAARAVAVRGDRMDFDPEIAVRLCWHGTPIVNLPTRVRYLEASEGGVSHFHMGRDNLLISWMHTRLVILAILRWLVRPFRRAT